MTTGPPIARPSTLAGLGASWRAASPTKIACSIIVAPRPPYSFGQEIPAQPAACSFSCHSRRKAITSSRPPSGSGPGLFASSQARTSSRNCSSDGDSVRSIAREHIAAAWPRQARRPLEHSIRLPQTLEAVLIGEFVGLVERAVAAFEQQRRGLSSRSSAPSSSAATIAVDLVLVAVRSAEFARFLRPGLRRSAPTTVGDRLLPAASLVGFSVSMLFSLAKSFGFLAEAFRCPWCRSRRPA